MNGLEIFTLVHVLISLAGIGSGLVVLWGLLTARRLDAWTAIFLIFTAATSITGFFFPFEKLLTSHILGVLSLIALALVIVGRYVRKFAGAWRWIYVVTTSLALYFNVIALVFQLFLKVPALHAAAPTQSELPFQIAQLVVLAAFAVLTIVAVRRFRPMTVGTD